MAITAKKFYSKVFRYDPKDDSLQFHIKLQLGKERRTFPTHCVDRAQAALKAREIYIYLHAEGMKAALAKYGSGPLSMPTETLGQLIAKVEKAWLGEARTISDYGMAVRRIFADIKGIERRSVHGQGKNRDKWLKAVDAIRIAEITRDQVEQWRAEYIQRANGDPARKAAAATSSNSLLRCAK